MTVSTAAASSLAANAAGGGVATVTNLEDSFWHKVTLKKNAGDSRGSSTGHEKSGGEKSKSVAEAAPDEVDEDEDNFMVEYFDASNKDVTPLPLYVPGWEELEKNQAASSEAKGKSKSRPNIMNTFLKMTSAIYTMAGLGGFEESKLYKEQIGEDAEEDSLAEERERAILGKTKEDEEREKEELERLKFQEQQALRRDPFAGRTDSVNSSGQQQGVKGGRIIDILLKETDTQWMLVLIGTCAEIEDDEHQPLKSKKPKEGEEEQKKKVSTESQTEGGDTASDYTAGEKKSASTSTTKTEEEPQLITHKYDLNEKWSQTIDFPRKKKGTQSDPIGTRDIGSQVLSKDLLG